MDKEHYRFQNLLIHYHQTLRCENLEKLKTMVTTKDTIGKEGFNKKLPAKDAITTASNPSTTTMRGFEKYVATNKTQISKERLNKLREVNGFSFGVRMIIITMLILLIFVPIYAMVRYLVLLSLINEPIYGILLACNTVETYTGLLLTDISLLEMVAWDNSVQIAGHSSKEYALKSIEKLIAIHAETLELNAKGIGETGRIIDKNLNENMCTHLRKFDSKNKLSLTVIEQWQA